MLNHLVKGLLSSLFKGIVSQNILLQVLAWMIFFQAYEYPIGTISSLLKLAKIFATKWKMRKLNTMFFVILYWEAIFTEKKKIAFSTKIMFNLRSRQSDILSSMNPPLLLISATSYHRRRWHLLQIHRRCHGGNFRSREICDRRCQGTPTEDLQPMQDTVYRRRQQHRRCTLSCEYLSECEI